MQDFLGGSVDRRNVEAGLQPLAGGKAFDDQFTQLSVDASLKGQFLALSNLWMAHKQLTAMHGQVLPQTD